MEMKHWKLVCVVLWNLLLLLCHSKKPPKLVKHDGPPAENFANFTSLVSSMHSPLHNYYHILFTYRTFEVDSQVEQILIKLCVNESDITVTPQHQQIAIFSSPKLSSSLGERGSYLRITHPAMGIVDGMTINYNTKLTHENPIHTYVTHNLWYVKLYGQIEFYLSKKRVFGPLC
jgi:hypothetical protein